jgi:hypothetical protein
MNRWSPRTSRGGCDSCWLLIPESGLSHANEPEQRLTAAQPNVTVAPLNSGVLSEECVRSLTGSLYPHSFPGVVLFSCQHQAVSSTGLEQPRVPRNPSPSFLTSTASAPMIVNER